VGVFLQNEWTVDDVMRFIDNTCRSKFGVERTEYYKRLIYENDIDGEVNRRVLPRLTFWCRACEQSPSRCLFIRTRLCPRQPCVRRDDAGLRACAGRRTLTVTPARPPVRLADHGGDDRHTAPEAGHFKFWAPPSDSETVPGILAE